MIKISIEKKLNSPSGIMNLKVDLEIPKGEFITLYGPSGAGKTSVLRMISGLMNPYRGEIMVAGKPWFSSKADIHIAPQKRKVGFVFQDYALFPNMTVRQNLEYANSGENHTIFELTEMMEIDGLLDMKPNVLSGGQQQRVALARALVQKPEILLLDEPMSALDQTIRTKIQDYLLVVHEKYKLTTILVSHDISEIIRLSDRVIRLENGKVIEAGIPSDFFTKTNKNKGQLILAQILKLEKQGAIYMAKVNALNSIVNIQLSEKDFLSYRVGSKVMIEIEYLKGKVFPIKV